MPLLWKQAEQMFRAAAVVGPSTRPLQVFYGARPGAYASHRDVLRVLSSMALLDAAAVGGAIQRMEQGRSSGMAHRVQRLADQGILRADVTPTRPQTCSGC